jgi:hypothetical protein
MDTQLEDPPRAMENRRECYAMILTLAHERAEYARLDRPAVLAGRGI